LCAKCKIKAGRYVGLLFVLLFCSKQRSKRKKMEMQNAFASENGSLCLYAPFSVTIHGRMRGVTSVATGVWFYVMVVCVIHYELHV
jgi:hypothetical protein